MSCTVADGRALSVHYDACSARYSFGKIGKPELTLDRPLTDLGFKPWPGIGRDIWEAAIFLTDGHRYEVFAGFQRPLGDEVVEVAPPTFGGVVVSRGGEDIARFECRTGTVEWAYGWPGLLDAKAAAGGDWDPARKLWHPAE